LSAAAIAGIAIGSFVAVAGIGAAAAVLYAKRNPHSRIAAILSRKGLGFKSNAAPTNF